MKEYKGYWMKKVTRRDVVVYDNEGNFINRPERNAYTYKEAKAFIDTLR